MEKEYKLKDKNTTRREEVYKHVYNDICNGALYSNLIDRLMEDYYNIGFKYSRHTAVDIISNVRRMLRKDFEEVKTQLREQLLAQLYDVYNEARAKEDRQSALAALKQIAKLTGADEAERFKVECDIFGNIDIAFGFDNQ